MRAKNITLVIVSIIIVGFMVSTYLTEKSMKTNRSNKEQSNSMTNVSNTDTNSSSNKDIPVNSNSNSQTNSSSNTNSVVNSNTNQSTNTNSNTNSSSNSNNKFSNTNVNSNVTTNTNQTSNSNVTSNQNLGKNVLASGTVDGKKIVVRNTCSGSATQAIDEYYRDTHYVYYFNTGISGCIRVEVNGKDYSIKEALNSKIVAPDEIEKVGYSLNKKSTGTVSR